MLSDDWLEICQQIMILPIGARQFEEALQMGSETYHHLKVIYPFVVSLWLQEYILQLQKRY